MVSQARYQAIDPNDNLHGAPDLVIEIKSPSNAVRSLRELASLGLANGGREFWFVDPDHTSVAVIHCDGSSLRFDSPGAVPLTVFGGGAILLTEIFGQA